MHDFKSHFQRDFLAYCTRPVSVHLATVSVGCLLNSFSIFLLGLKQQQNLMKIKFSCRSYPPPPPHNEKLFYTGKLYGLTGMGWGGGVEKKGSTEEGNKLQRKGGRYMPWGCCAIWTQVNPLTVSTNGLLWPSIVRLIQQKLERSTPTPEDFSSFFCVGGIKQWNANKVRKWLTSNGRVRVNRNSFITAASLSIHC